MYRFDIRGFDYITVQSLTAALNEEEKERRRKEEQMLEDRKSKRQQQESIRKLIEKSNKVRQS